MTPKYPKLYVPMGNLDEAIERLDNLRSAEDQIAMVGRDAERYYALLARARETMRGMFSAAEVKLIADSCNGTLWTPATMCCLAIGVEDSIVYSGLDGKWGVDGEALLSKLRRLSLVQIMAIVDVIERFWSAPESYAALRALNEAIAD